MDLSKAQKKYARELIQRSLQVECGDFFKSIANFLHVSENKELSDHENYLKLYTEVKNFDKHIAFRYNGMGGSKYLPCIIELYMDNLISENDLDGFGEDLKNRIISLKKHLEE